MLEQAGAQRGIRHKEAERLADYIRNLRELAAKKQFALVADALKADVPEYARIWVRLTKPVPSKESRCGEKLAGVVIAPAVSGGRIVLSPGTKVEGTLLSVRSAKTGSCGPKRCWNSPTFCRRTEGSQDLPLGSSRWTTRGRRSITAASSACPFPTRRWAAGPSGCAGSASCCRASPRGLRLSTHAYNLTLSPEIDFKEGTELILRVAVPEKLNTKAPQRGWREIPASKALVELVRRQPLRVKTPSGEDSDIVNLMFIGSQEDLETGFGMAGWVEARSLGVKTGLITALQALRRSGYSEAPFSLLQLEGKDPDYEYQEDLNTVAKRHHFRVFRRPDTYHGQSVSVASATHDIGIGMGRRATQWYHLIDPEIDEERQKIADDLLFTGLATGYTLVDRPEAPRRAAKATGDELHTDGRMMVLHLTGEKEGRRAQLSPPAGNGRGI